MSRDLEGGRREMGARGLKNRLGDGLQDDPVRQAQSGDGI
jgi:hypothetical protein